MLEYYRQILTGQFEAALCMLRECALKCPEDHWHDKIGNDSFRQVVYHALFFVDLYLSTNEAAFQLRDLHHRGGDERTSSTANAGLSKEETLAYVAICRQKMLETLPAETAETLQRPSGFSWLAFTRGELHLYNLRHLQHHTGQLSAFLRRLIVATESWWVKTGWR